ncbi:hypothetical protein [Actinoplanes sp. NBRC 101535]|uniref:hypothetical protein n=1 Tax=Actinoplanes sp. NBRC 101535 TaxID=3032196 RepID=UPI0025565CF9|nr:hypothetical protein [Actinoplanes sp. NBRC 101535]
MYDLLVKPPPAVTATEARCGRPGTPVVAVRGEPGQGRISSSPAAGMVGRVTARSS